MTERLKIMDWLVGEGGPFRVRGLLALSINGVALALFLQGQPVPDPLLGAWGLVNGVYLGSRIAASGKGGN